MEDSSRLVEEPVDGQPFFLARRSDRLALGVELDRTLLRVVGARRGVGRPAPSAGGQRQPEREHERADRGKTQCWTDGTAHCAPLRPATHTTDRVRQARGKPRCQLKYPASATFY